MPTSTSCFPFPLFVFNRNDHCSLAALRRPPAKEGNVLFRRLPRSRRWWQCWRRQRQRAGLRRRGVAETTTLKLQVSVNPMFVFPRR